MLNRPLVVPFGVWMLALTGAFYAFPAWHLVLWSSLALSSAGAIAVGVLIHRPSHPIPWWLLALAVTVFAAGDTTYNVLTTMLGQEQPFPSLADVFYLAMYPIAAAGLVLLIRRRTGGRDRGSLLDALSVTTALGAAELDLPHRPVRPERRAHVAGTRDVDRLPARRRPHRGDTRPPAHHEPAATVRPLCSVSARPGSSRPTSVYGLEQLERLVGDRKLLRLRLGGLLHRPGGSRRCVRRWPISRSRCGRRRAEMSIGRIALLMAVSLVAPGALLADSLTGDVEHGPMIAASSAVLFLLVLARLAGVVARHRQAVERERTLRSAGDDLVSAADAADVATAVRTAVGRLLPAGSRHRAVLLTDGATAGVLGPGADTPDRASRLVHVDDLDGVGGSGAGRGSRPRCRARSCSVDRPTAGPSMGLLVVAAGETVLLTLRGALEVLASQAALAVERVTLSQEVTRRNNEAYFRTLVQNAHDVILIVDDGGRVRYASPSAEAMFGPGSVVGKRRPRPRRARRPRRRRARAARVWAGGATSGTRSYRIDAHGWRPPRRRGGLPRPPGRSDRPRRRAHPAGRHRAAEAGARAHPPGVPRLAHRAREPGAVPGPGRAGARRHRRDGGVVGVLLVDLDDFKLVNDTMGHGIGDELLVAVAARLIAVLRPGDTRGAARRGRVRDTHRGRRAGQPRSRRSRRASSTPSAPRSTSPAG